MSGERALAAAEEILRYEREVNEALRRLARRTHYEPATVDVPLRDVFEASVDESLDEWAIRKETIRKFFEYLLADGPEPWQLLRRLFAIGAHMAIEPFCLLNLRERGLMLGDSHGAQHWRTRRIVAGLQRNGALSVKAPGQKGAKASAAAHKAQLGNQNRVSAHGGADAPPKKTKRKTPIHEKDKIHHRSGHGERGPRARGNRNGHTGAGNHHRNVSDPD